MFTIRLEKNKFSLDKNRRNIDKIYLSLCQYNMIPAIPAMTIIKMGLILNFHVSINAAPNMSQLL